MAFFEVKGTSASGDPSVEVAELFSATQVLKWFMTESFKWLYEKKSLQNWVASHNFI